MGQSKFTISASLKLLEEKGVVRRVAKIPEFIALEMASKLPSPPEGKNWIFESKYDGYRMETVKDRQKIRVRSRNNQDWSHKFLAIQRAVADLPFHQLVFDGEVIVEGRGGVSNFSALQAALKQNFKDPSQAPFIYCVFDMLYLDGFDLRPAPLLVRKQLLEYVLQDQSPTESLLRWSPHTQGDGPKRLAQARRRKWEGIMAKDGTRPYRAGRGVDWIKVKCRLEEEFVIAGYTDPQGNRQEFGSLLLGYYSADRKKLIYAGRVGTGFKGPILKEIKKVVERDQSTKNPFANILDRAELSGVHFTKPQLVAQIGYAEWTADKRLRQAAFLGLREDKKQKKLQGKGESYGTQDMERAHQLWIDQYPR